MSQKITPQTGPRVEKKFENVAEIWTLYDSTLITEDVDNLSFNEGYFANFAAVGAANEIPFFNVRNRNSGLAYNNQDKKGQMPYAMLIYSIGVQFWGPSTTLYYNNSGTPDGSNTIQTALWETEIPKHTSLELWTNQDNRLTINSLMSSAGVGPVGGGYAQGSTEAPQLQYPTPNITKTSNNQGVATLTNRWGFPNPLEVPRTANLSVILKMSEYARQLLGAMDGANLQAFKAVAADNSWVFKPACFGIRVYLTGMRLVQQRGQLHV